MSGRKAGEPRGIRWLRRSITVPGYFGMAGLLLAGLPVLLAVAVVSDWIRGSSYAAARALLFGTYYAVAESVGLLASFTVWMVALVLPGVSPDRYEQWNFRLQKAWAGALFGGARRLFDLRLDVDGEGRIGSGPVLVFMRHASVADTLLPAVFLSSRAGLRLRYVMKRELLWDPCLDVVGQRLPNVFVRRDAADGAREIAAIKRLGADLRPNEGVLLYPEGTRFTPGKQKRVLARLERAEDPTLLARAQRLRHVLPPRLGGPMGLLEQCPDTDVLFCGHVGFDSITTLADLWKGSLVGLRVRVRFWRVTASEIPADREGRVDWLYKEWTRLDVWIDEQKRDLADEDPPE
jgi:1-acyl-sn-glycerol-3-phosphate acyltransferase